MVEWTRNGKSTCDRSVRPLRLPSVIPVPVECHEVWDYDDDRKIQRLERRVALCPACHEVKHAGLASK